MDVSNIDMIAPLCLWKALLLTQLDKFSKNWEFLFDDELHIFSFFSHHKVNKDTQTG